MPKHQILLGASVALLSIAGFWKTDWLLEHSGKGQWFVRRYGQLKARAIVRSFFFFAIAFGILLAANIIRPIQW